MEEMNYRKAQGVFVVICDGDCDNCWLSGSGWNFRLQEDENDKRNHGFVGMNGHSPCEMLIGSKTVMVIKHRTDTKAVSDEDRLNVGNCDDCGCWAPNLYCKRCAKKIFGKETKEPRTKNEHPATREFWQPAYKEFKKHGIKVSSTGGVRQAEKLGLANVEYTDFIFKLEKNCKEMIVQLKGKEGIDGAAVYPLMNGEVTNKDYFYQGDSPGIFIEETLEYFYVPQLDVIPVQQSLNVKGGL